MAQSYGNGLNLVRLFWLHILKILFCQRAAPGSVYRFGSKCDCREERQCRLVGRRKMAAVPVFTRFYPGLTALNADDAKNAPCRAGRTVRMA